MTAVSPLSPDRLTPQQGRAVVTRDTSVVLSSGAGCGKTHVLTERYLSHLRDDGAEVGQVVAITFTDRAARADARPHPRGRRGTPPRRRPRRRRRRNLGAPPARPGNRPDQHHPRLLRRPAPPARRRGRAGPALRRARRSALRQPRGRSAQFLSAKTADRRRRKRARTCGNWCCCTAGGRSSRR